MARKKGPGKRGGPIYLHKLSTGTTSRITLPEAEALIEKAAREGDDLWVVIEQEKHPALNEAGCRIIKIKSSRARFAE